MKKNKQSKEGGSKWERKGKGTERWEREAHHAQERPSQRVPKVPAPIFRLVEPPLIRILPLPLPSRTELLPRHLPPQRRQQVFCGLLITADVETGHAEVVNGPGESRANLEGSTVGVDGQFGVAAVGEGGAESVPEEEVL